MREFAAVAFILFLFLDKVYIVMGSLWASDLFKQLRT